MYYYVFALTIVGLVSGLLAGFVGAGAEIAVVPLLTLFGVLGSLKRRIGTSLFMILPPIGIFSAMKFYKNNYVDVRAAIYMATIFTFAAYYSSRISIYMNTDILRKLFGIFTIFSGIYIYYSEE